MYGISVYAQTSVRRVNIASTLANMTCSKRESVLNHCNSLLIQNKSQLFTSYDKHEVNYKFSHCMLTNNKRLLKYTGFLKTKRQICYVMWAGGTEFIRRTRVAEDMMTSRKIVLGESLSFLNVSRGSSPECTKTIPSTRGRVGQVSRRQKT